MEMAVGRAARRRLAHGLPVLVLLAGCQHDPVDTPVGWWHQLEGGAIAGQRPPPPGVDDPYPHVGTTPAAAPEVASIELRRSVTEQLVEQRNLSARQNAHDPLPPPVAARPAKAASVPSVAPPVPNPAQSSAVLDAADAPPPPTPVAPPPVVAPPHAAAVASDEPDLAMPAFVASGAPDGPAEMPPIPGAPPPPPGLPGLAMPPPPSYAPPTHPAYALTTPPGDPLKFVAGSDVLGPDQAKTLLAIASHRHGGTIFVHGYGDATSDAPQDQAQALTLAAYRARSVADALEKQGVPASAIQIRADAFGRGASAGLID